MISLKSSLWSLRLVVCVPFLQQFSFYSISVFFFICSHRRFILNSLYSNFLIFVVNFFFKRFCLTLLVAILFAPIMSRIFAFHHSLLLLSGYILRLCNCKFVFWSILVLKLCIIISRFISIPMFSYFLFNSCTHVYFACPFWVLLIICLVFEALILTF